MKLFIRKQEYLLRKTLQQRQARSLSLNQSTAIISNFNGEYQTIPLVNQLNQDIQLTEVSPIRVLNE
jgi:hypothetical protein